MIYVYECPKCKKRFEVIKSVRYIDVEEICENCQTPGRRIIVPGVSFFGEKDWDTAQWDPVVGKVIKNNAERKRIARERGWEEIGDYPVDKLHAHHEANNLKKREDAWAKV